MDTIKVTLCPACGGCRAVEITDEAVTIGEAENTVKLTHAEWNDLVARVRSGELNEIRILDVGRARLSRSTVQEPSAAHGRARAKLPPPTMHGHREQKESEMETIAESRVTCPACGHVERLSMPTDYCLFFMNARAAETCSKPRRGLAVVSVRTAMFLARRCKKQTR